MNLIERRQLADSWKEEVFDKSDSVDPDDEYCWESLAVGFALGNKLSAKDAKDFAFELGRAALL